MFIIWAERSQHAQQSSPQAHQHHQRLLNGSSRWSHLEASYHGPSISSFYSFYVDVNTSHFRTLLLMLHKLFQQISYLTPVSTKRCVSAISSAPKRKNKPTSEMTVITASAYTLKSKLNLDQSSNWATGSWHKRFISSLITGTKITQHWFNVSWPSLNFCSLILWVWMKAIYSDLTLAFTGWHLTVSEGEFW